MAESHRDEVAKLEALYASNPEGRLFTHLAEAYRKAGELNRARDMLESGLARHPEYSSAYVVLGRVLQDLSRPGEAEQAFHRVLDLDAENRVAVRALGDLARAGGRAEEALDFYRQLHALDPADEALSATIADLEASAATAAPSEAGDGEEGAAALVQPSEVAAAPQAGAEAAAGDLEESDAGAATGDAEELGMGTDLHSLEAAVSETPEATASAQAAASPEVPGGPEAPGAEEAAGAEEAVDIAPVADVTASVGEVSDMAAEAAGAADGSQASQATESVTVAGAEGAADVEQAPATEEVEQAPATKEVEQAPAAEEVGQAPATEEMEQAPAAEDVGQAPAAEDVGLAEGGEEADAFALELEVWGEQDETAEEFSADLVLDGSWAQDEAAAGGAEEGRSDGEWRWEGEVGEDDESPAMTTETMAELYRAQGLFARAAEIYRQLLRERPGDERLRSRLESVEGEIEARPAVEAPESEVEESLEAAAVESIESFEEYETWDALEPDEFGGEPFIELPEAPAVEESATPWTDPRTEPAADTTPYVWDEADEEDDGPRIGAQLRELVAWRSTPGAAHSGAQPPAASAVERVESERQVAAEEWTPYDLDAKSVASELEPLPDAESSAAPPIGDDQELAWLFGAVDEMEADAQEPAELSPELDAADGEGEDAEDDDLELFRAWLQSLKR